MLFLLLLLVLSCVQVIPVLGRFKRWILTFPVRWGYINEKRTVIEVFFCFIRGCCCCCLSWIASPGPDSDTKLRKRRNKRSGRTHHTSKTHVTLNRSINEWTGFIHTHKSSIIHKKKSRLFDAINRREAPPMGHQAGASSSSKKKNILKTKRGQRNAFE